MFRDVCLCMAAGLLALSFHAFCCVPGGHKGANKRQQNQRNKSAATTLLPYTNTQTNYPCVDMDVYVNVCVYSCDRDETADALAYNSAAVVFSAVLGGAAAAAATARRWMD